MAGLGSIGLKCNRYNYEKLTPALLEAAGNVGHVFGETVDVGVVGLLEGSRAERVAVGRDVTHDAAVRMVTLS